MFRKAFVFNIIKIAAVLGIALFLIGLYIGGLLYG